jgi:hypothetical protein
LAGFLDGDGSIYVRLKCNDSYRFGFQVSPSVVFYQSNKKKSFLVKLMKEERVGYIRDRKDGIVEWIIGDVKSIQIMMTNLTPFLRLKRKQAKLMLDILKRKKRVKNVHDFLKLVKLIDRFEELNYSKKRKIDLSEVSKVLVKKKLLTP